MLRTAVPILLVSTLSATQAQDEQQSTADLLRDAGRQVQQQEFEAAAKLFRKVVEADEDNAQGWFMLGYALHMDGKLDEAIKAHEKATEFSQTRVLGFYNLGCAYALKGKKPRAFNYLNRAVKAGFSDVGQAQSDEDLDSLREDIRFKRFMMRVEGEAVTDDFNAKSLAGRWVMVAETKAGQKTEKPEGYADLTSDSYTVTTPDGKEGPIPFEVDTSKLVPTITVAGQAKGILRMMGDKLTVCINTKSAEAPKDFQSTEDNGFEMFTVRRATTPARLAGTWSYVSGVRAGEKVEKERLIGDVKVTGDKFEIPAGPDSKFVMTYSIKSNSKSDTIDLSIESGPAPEGKAVGLVRVRGNIMTLIYEPTGENRPSEFKSTADNGCFMFTLKRRPQAKEKPQSK